MNKLVVFMRFIRGDRKTYSGTFTYICETAGECRWCCQQEISEFEQAGWLLESYEVKSVNSFNYGPGSKEVSKRKGRL